MTRLALVGPSWPLRGGIARTTTALAAALDARGSLAGFLVPARQYPAFLFPGAGDTDPDACPRLPRAEPCFGVFEPWTWGALASRLRALRPEAVVVPFWTAAWAPLEVFLIGRRVAPAVAVVHNPADHGASRPARTAARAVLRRCAAFLCHGRSVAAALREPFPETPLAVHPLPPGRAAPRERERARERLGLAPEAVAALCFGLIRPYKGVEVLLDAVAALPRETPVTLLLVGEPWGGLGETLRKRLARPDLAGRVVARLEWVPESEVGEWFAAADLAVLPYLSATGSAVAAQALAWGLPIVATAVGGLVDVVRDDVNGLLVPPGRPDTLAAAIARLAGGELRARLARGAREESARWTWDGYAAELEALVARVLAGSTPRAEGRRA